MQYCSRYCLTTLILLAFSAGCEEQNPIQLSNKDLGSQDLELITETISPEVYLGTEGTPMDYVSTIPADFPPPDRRYLGQLTIAGGEFDTPTEHHESLLARALFMNRYTPIVVNNDTIAYEAIDVGAVHLDSLPLTRLPVSVNARTSRGLIDTILGVQYTLAKRDSAGIPAFRFAGGHLYRWHCSGSYRFSGFVTEILSPPRLHVVSPTPGDKILLSDNLLVRWEGGSSYVKIIVSDFRTLRPKPILQIRIGSNRGNVVLPSSLLQLLPRDAPKFLFTFLSETDEETRFNNYPENVSLRAVTIHSLLLEVSR